MLRDRLRTEPFTTIEPEIDSLLSKSSAETETDKRERLDALFARAALAFQLGELSRAETLIDTLLSEQDDVALILSAHQLRLEIKLERQDHIAAEIELKELHRALETYPNPQSATGFILQLYRVILLARFKRKSFCDSKSLLMVQYSLNLFLYRRHHRTIPI